MLQKNNTTIIQEAGLIEEFDPTCLYYGTDGVKIAIHPDTGHLMKAMLTVADMQQTAADIDDPIKWELYESFSKYHENDRTADWTVTTTLPLSEGDILDLVKFELTDKLAFEATGDSITGQTIEVDFGGAETNANTMRWLQANSQDLGQWKVEGYSSADEAWYTLSPIMTLGSNSNTEYTLNSVGKVTKVRLTGISGSMDFVPYIYDIDFK